MDGVSAAKSAFEVLEMIKTCVELAKLYYGRAKAAGKTLQDGYLGFDKCHTALEMWIQFWDLNGGLSRRYQEELWSRDGARTIILQLAKIKDQMEDVRKELDPLLSEAGTTSTNLPEFSWSTAKELRQGAKALQKQLGIRNIFRFVRGKGEDILLLVAAVDRSIAELLELSKTCFSLKHGPALLQQSPDAIATRAGLSNFLGLASDARLAAAMYFDDLFGLLRGGLRGTARPKSAQLELDAVVSPRYTAASGFKSMTHIPLQYHLSLSGETRSQWKPLQMLVDGPLQFFRPGELQAPMPSASELGIKHAYYAARESSALQFAVRSGDKAASAHFRVRPPRPKDQIFPQLSPDVRASEPLAKVLRPIPMTAAADPTDASLECDFPRSARVLLAHKVVLAGMFLCGSSWFASLRRRIHSISRSSLLSAVDAASQGLFGIEDHRYILEIEMENETQDADGLEKTSQQVYLLGLLLIELGIGWPLKGVRRKDAQIEPSFEFAITKQPDSSGSVAGFVVAYGWLYSVILVLLSLVSRLRMGIAPKGARVAPPVTTTTILTMSEVCQRLSAAMGEHYTTVARQCLSQPFRKDLLKGNLGSTEKTESLPAEFLGSYWSELCLRLEEDVQDIKVFAITSQQEKPSRGKDICV